MTERTATVWWTSLRGRLILLALIGFLPLFGLAVYRAVETRQQAFAEARATVVRLAQLAELNLALRIRGTRHLVHAMAANPMLGGKDFAACSAALAAQLKLDERYAAIVVAGREGKLLCHSDPTAEPVNYSDRDDFRRVLETRQPVVGKPVIWRVAKRAIITVDQPLLDANGEVRRVLIASLDLALVMANISGPLSAKDISVAISDEEGRVLYRQPDNDKWFGRLDPSAPINQALRAKRPGEAFESVGFEGVTRVFAFVHSREHAEGSLLIRVGAARDALTAAADRELALALVVLIIMASLVLFTVIHVAEKFVRGPVAALAHASGRLAEGDLSVRVPETEFSGELAGLAAGFNRMAAALRTQMARAEAVVESAPDPIVIVDRKGRIVVVNARAEAVFGYSRAELLGRPVEQLIPEHLHAAHVAHRAPYQEKPQARAMAAGRDLFARRKDGSEFAVDVSLSPLVTPEGTLVISTVRDVTERRQAERRIREQLEHLNLLDHITRATGERQDLRSIFQVIIRSLEDSLPVDFGCVCVHDRVANTLLVTCVGAKSEALARELTMDENASIDIDENGLSRCVQGQLVYEPDIGQVRFPFPERLARGGLGSLVMAPLRSESRVFGVLVAARRESHSFSSVECEFLRQLSEHVALAAHQAQLYGALQQAYDDLRQTQQAVMQQERLRALGQMASGIAHDINNALSPVSLYTESLLETEPNLSKRARGYLETIQRAVEDVAQTVARMREFYRPREAQLALTPVPMNDMVQQVVDLTRARWNDMPQQRGIVIRALTELAPDLPRIMGVESEIREALTNLVFNAVDAMPEGGTLTLRTRLAGAAESREPAFVVVEVADTGAGMDEVTRRRCLEPFFTTKGERGTGLGLAMVFGMVQRHSAELEIDSAPGAGTTMRLFFAVSAAVPVEPGRPAGALEAPSRLRLLLIDDDPILLKSLQDALETDGHVLVTANGGEEGIAAFRASLDRGESFAAVITDLGMPYVDGRQVAAAVKETSRATPVILLTGWGQRLVAEGSVPPHVDRVLAKPPKLRELREALAQLCRSGPS